MINEKLSKAEAEEIFQRESFYMFGSDVIPEYKCYELSGEAAAEYVSRGCFKVCEDYGWTGACSIDRPHRNYFYKTGFMRIVTEHNYLVMVGAYKESEGGRIADKYQKIKDDKFAEMEAAEEAKRTERKAKRAAAKAARETKQNK